MWIRDKDTRMIIIKLILNILSSESGHVVYMIVQFGSQVLLNSNELLVIKV